MGRSKWLLLLLIPMLFGFDTRNPFRTRGPFKAYDFTVGLGGGASEIACQNLGSVCGASEPMNTATFTGTCTSAAQNANFSDSTGSKELGSSAWQNCRGLSMVATTGDAAMPPGGTASYVAKVSPTADALNGQQMTATGVPAGTKRHCTRVYTKFSSGFRGFNTCGANKITEFWAGGVTQVQLSEVGGRIGLSAVGANWSNANPTCTGSATPYACCFGAGDGCGDQIGGVTSPTANQTFGLSDCTSNWCRVEICASTSDAELESGTNVTLEGTITQVDVATPKTITFGPTFAGNMAGSWTETWVRTGYRETCSSGTDYFYMSHGMTANWTTNSGQTIGAACEVEGGC